MKPFVCFFLIFLLKMSIVAQAQQVPALEFNSNGRFKIVQFTDIHMKEYNDATRDSAMNVIVTVLHAEKPDLVILTGDVATSRNMEAAWSTVVRPMIDVRIPWAAVFGNHDGEHTFSNKEIMEFLLTLPYNCSQVGPAYINGAGNYVLEIKGSTDKKEKALIYCLDSNAYTEDRKNPELGKYDWIRFDQIKWYRETSRAYTMKNGNNPLPALAFFHIPLPEYDVVAKLETTVGVKFENVASPVINSGMYNAMLEMKDVMGVFVGHDHDNNYIGALNGICLAYGCKTGFESYGKLDKGARVIELHEEGRRFDSWIHTLKKSKAYFVSYPEAFQKTNE